MSARKMAEPGYQEQGAQGPFDRHQPIRVSLGVYLISIVVACLIVFVLMLVQYLPGYRNNYRLSQMMKKSDVTLKVVIPMDEVRKRKSNPFTAEQEKQTADTLADMGARVVVEKGERVFPRVEIEPEVKESGVVK